MRETSAFDKVQENMDRHTDDFFSSEKINKDIVLANSLKKGH